MLDFRVHPEADVEAIEAASYIKEDAPQEAELFKTALVDAITWARSQPLAFATFNKDFRKVRIGKFRYLVIFRIENQEIEILAIAHTSRKPGYWSERVKHHS